MDTQNTLSLLARKRVKDYLLGTWVELTLSDGSIRRIQRMDSGSTMGLPGWHDINARTGCSYLADTQADAINAILRGY